MFPYSTDSNKEERKECYIKYVVEFIGDTDEDFNNFFEECLKESRNGIKEFTKISNEFYEEYCANNPYPEGLPHNPDVVKWYKKYDMEWKLVDNYTPCPSIVDVIIEKDSRFRKPKTKSIFIFSNDE